MVKVKSAIKKLAVILSIVFIVGLPVAAFANRQEISDWLRLQGYSAPNEVVELADATTMTEYGRKLFYVNRPQILSDKAEFSNACDQGEESIVLGCYGTGKGIYLYRVTDSRLKGVLEVTAAHEMLHAAYERLDDKEKIEVDALTSKTLDKLTDQRIKESIDRYRKRDPSVVSTELHSILATEVKNIPHELEVHYKKYFNNRVKVVEYSERYESEFSSRQIQVAAYDKQLESLKASIDSQQVLLEGLALELKTERTRLDALRNGDATNYNVAASAYNKRVAEYNVMARQLQNKIEDYNRLVKKRNEVAVEVQNLVEAIDSRPEEL